MSILGRGDLVPRRRRGRSRWPLFLLVLVVLVGVGYVGDRYVWPHFRPSSTTASPPPCPSRSAAPPVPAAREVSLRVRNSTLRVGLASRVATSLHHRGFRIRGVGNTSVTVTGTATVRYSADRAQQAKALAAQIRTPVMVQVGGRGVLELDLGRKWRALATTQAARAAVRADRTPATPLPTCTPHATAAARG